MPAHGSLEIRHQVDRGKREEAGLNVGERYQASFTDKCLETRWWAFGSLEDFEDVTFRWWREGEDKRGAGDGGRYFMGEDPDDLALVIEKGAVEFEIRHMVDS